MFRLSSAETPYDPNFETVEYDAATLSVALRLRPFAVRRDYSIAG